MPKKNIKLFSQCSFTLYLALVIIIISTISFAHSIKEEWEAYEINAQYRGNIKQGFEKLGCAVAYFSYQNSDEKSVIFHACVKDPENKNSYYGARIGLNYTYNLARNIASTSLEKYAWFENFETQYHQQIKDLLIFLAILKSNLQHCLSCKEININNTKVFLNTVKVGKNKVEINIFTKVSPKLEGKFFLEKSSETEYKITKFRMKKDKVSVSFITQPIKVIKQKYQNIPPFDRVVFGN